MLAYIPSEGHWYQTGKQVIEGYIIVRGTYSEGWNIYAHWLQPANTHLRLLSIYLMFVRSVMHPTYAVSAV